MELQIGVAKINKYASSESGDTLEVVERPNGGLSVVLADGQRSGRSAKLISNMVVRKVVSLLAEGVRDGAAARAASDYLYSHSGGKVQSTLNIMSIDLVTNTLVLTRNNQAPMIVNKEGQTLLLDEDSKSVGIYRNTRPIITEFNLEEGLTVVAFTDGLVHAGTRTGEKLEISQEIELLLEQDASSQTIADQLMKAAMELDQGRPVDDISVVVLRVTTDREDKVRRLTVRLPIK